jgi:hypothetical protein
MGQELWYQSLKQITSHHTDNHKRLVDLVIGPGVNMSSHYATIHFRKIEKLPQLLQLALTSVFACAGTLP